MHIYTRMAGEGTYTNRLIILWLVKLRGDFLYFFHTLNFLNVMVTFTLKIFNVAHNTGLQRGKNSTVDLEGFWQETWLLRKWSWCLLQAGYFFLLLQELHRWKGGGWDMELKSTVVSSHDFASAGPELWSLSPWATCASLQCRLPGDRALGDSIPAVPTLIIILPQMNV